MATRIRDVRTPVSAVGLGYLRGTFEHARTSPLRNRRARSALRLRPYRSRVRRYGSDTTDTTAADTTATAGANAQQRIDSAVKSCNEKAQEVGGTAGTTLQGACQLVGTAAKQALKEGGAKAKQALAQASSSCRTAVAQIPSNEAKDALTSLCDAVGSAQ